MPVGVGIPGFRRACHPADEKPVQDTGYQQDGYLHQSGAHRPIVTCKMPDSYSRQPGAGVKADYRGSPTKLWI
jgi:hypothetical protein